MLWIPLLLACASTSADSAQPCRHAVVTDIDETLTTSDDEWIAQMGEASHDPAMRPAADQLMNAYADAGYAIVYITARGEDFAMSDGRTSREATSDWLEAHGFPVSDERLFLSEGYGVAGEDAVAYKSEVLADQVADDWTHAWAYGNADSDIAAFQTALDDEHIFLVGELAGTLGVQPIPDDEAFEAHLAALDIEPGDCAE